MANPAITGSMTLRYYGTVIDLSTATAENILANKASSGTVVRVDSLIVGNDDGTNSANITLAVYDQDGTGMNSNTGIDEAAIGADVVAGSSKGAIVSTLAVAADEAQVIIDKTNPLYLMEDTSLVATASAANDLTITLNYTVLG